MAKGIYNGLDFDSDEERYFLMWALELQKHGIIKKIDRAETYLLYEGHYITETITKQLKTKVNVVEKITCILRPHEYTPDFLIEWADKNLLPLTYDNVSLIEIKPDYQTTNNMERLFKINQKWMHDKYKLHVCLVKPNELFTKTFTPTQFLITNKSGKSRKIKWKVTTCQEYLVKNC